MLKKRELPWFRYTLTEIQAYKKRVRLLDIGYGHGFLLNEARELGFEAYGVELQDVSTIYAKNTFGLKVFRGEIMDDHYPPDFF